MLLEGLEARSNKDGPLEDLSLMCYLTEFIDPIELFLNWNMERERLSMPTISSASGLTCFLTLLGEGLSPDFPVSKSFFLLNLSADLYPLNKVGLYRRGSLIFAT